MSYWKWFRLRILLILFVIVILVSVNIIYGDYPIYRDEDYKTAYVVSFPEFGLYSESPVTIFK